MVLQRLDPETLMTPAGYSQVVVAPPGGTLVFVAGQVSSDATGATVAPGDHVGQAAQAYRNLAAALEAAGASVADVTKTTTFVVGYRPDLRREMGRARAAVFGDHRPASTLVGVSALAEPDYLVEVEAIAVVGSEPSADRGPRA